jgi:GH25 family lysozyme M1 (1,4-beta-N-acetylmuramidase)
MRTSRRIAIAASSALLLLGSTVPASAAPSPEIMSAEQDIQQNNHTIGSQIRRVEGDTSTPESRAKAERPQPEAGVFATVAGMDVASYQGNVDWGHWWGQGKRFVWTKATEGTSYRNPYFAQQYNGSYNQGFIRGAYHFALPGNSSGASQANFFSNNGGGWSGDGRTLPGALDMEYNPYGATCYGLSKAAMTAWIKDFSDTYKARWNKYPAIYTSTSWWNQCVGSSFSATNPLWVARYASSVGTLPVDWGVYTVWQYSSSPIDQNTFNGSYDRLVVFATNSD